MKNYIPVSEVHGLNNRASNVDISFDKTVEHLQELFRRGHQIIGIASTGILIRAVAPLLSNKTQEPSVLSLSEDGKFVIPLLGGHSGANHLAQVISSILEIEASITTAGDSRFGIMLDNPPDGWRIANRDAAKLVMADL